MTEDPGLVWNLATLAGLLVLSAFFSASEVAFVSLSPARVRALADDRPSRAARLVVELKGRPQRFLATILIGNNIVNIFAASLATLIGLQLFGDAGLGIATGVMTVLVLIFGEIFPKALAQRHALGFALVAAYPLWFLDRLLLPISGSIDWLLTRLGVSRIGKTITEQELLAAVDIGTEEGEIQHHERELIQNVLEFTDTRVSEVMRPRVDIIAVSRDLTVAEARAVFEKNRFSRLPVFDGTIDRVAGIISLRRVLEHGDEPERPLAELEFVEPIFTPESRPVRSLLQEFLSRRRHMAIVVDEHGGTLGLVTLEDLLEELVGDIEDEADVREQTITRLNSRTVRADGGVHLAEIDEAIETELASGEFVNKNVAYLVLEKLGRMPRVNDRVRAGEAEITVEEVVANRIETVKVERLS